MQVKNGTDSDNQTWLFEQYFYDTVRKDFTLGT